ncbi:uncharacterized protein LOC120155008 isoform X2 [Hibiscus syriacus]|uniref:uncharacterized protein LOC120155008 isoform X2 n=1 Tax=Hibiscus syriacus TaxID=106335 RepID=UPI001924B844|nr:uncharacterized protein LOC120155008 isoform X2 [Hibiscus syriacus]
MSDSDDIAADLILLESQRKGLINTLEKLQCGSSLVPSLTLQCQKIHQLSNSIQNAIQTRFELLRSKDIEIENRLKDLELRENEVGKRSKDKLHEVLIGEGSSLLDLRFIVSSDGERLLMFLNAHGNEHEKLADEVYNVLKMSKNPAKLVWQGVKRVFMEQRNVGVEKKLERRSCLVLLEGLMRVGTQFNKRTKNEATSAAKAWKVKMGMEGEDTLLFLMLVGAFGLQGQFNSNEIRSLFERVAQNKQASLLGHNLGLFEKAAPESCILHSQGKTVQSGEVSNVTSETINDTKINYSSTPSADLRFIASTDADRLLMFLNEHENNDRIGIDVYNALKVSNKPAKLVLNVVKAGISGKTNVGIDKGVVKNSCIILLEQLMRLRPVISQKLRKKALKVAQIWKGSIRNNSNYDKEILVFLMLVGAYGLTSEFNSKEIESLFQCVSQHKQAPILSPMLGSLDQNLVRGIHHSPVKIEQSEADNFQLDSFVPSEQKFEQHIASSTTMSWPELRFLSINMNARGLILFLSECVEDHNLMRGEISDAFQLASDPAKLVLETSSYFYRSKSGDGFKGVALSNARKSCILLLEQLMACSVQIEPHVNEEALKLAVEWKERMEEKYPQGVMAYGFLQFIITYQLKSSYNVDELLRLLVTASEYRQSPDLCLALGLADKISILIETLINNNLRLEAIAYICSFDLADKFPPAQLLNAHLKYSKMRKSRMKKSNVKLGLENYVEHLERQKELGNDTAERGKQKEVKKNNLSIPSTKDEMQQESELNRPCINPSGEAAPSPFASAGGNFHFKPSPLEQPISFLADPAEACSLWGSAAFSMDTHSFNRQCGCEIADNWNLENFTSTTRAVDRAAPGSSIHHAQVKIDQCQSDNSNWDAFVPSEAKYEQYKACSSSDYGIDLQSFSTSMDSMGLILFLCKQVDDHDLMRSEISDALQLAPDPAKLVLDAISAFYESKSRNAPKKKSGNEFNSQLLHSVRKSCILLLEQLRTFPFLIEPHVNEEVLKLAVDWKERAQKCLKGVMAYGFLQLTVTYSLISDYDVNELLGLLVIASEYQQSPELCMALGLTEKIRVLIETLVQRNLRLEAIGYVCAFDLVDKFPPAQMLKAHLEYSKQSLHQQAQKSHWKWHQIIDHKIAAVRKVIRCIADHNLESLYPPNDLEDYIKQLEKQKEDRNDAARKEKQKRVRKKTPKASSANTKTHESGTSLSSPTTSTAGSTAKLSPLQLLESFFPDQAVSRGLWDTATYSTNLNLLSDNQQADAASIEGN